MCVCNACAKCMRKYQATSLLFSISSKFLRFGLIIKIPSALSMVAGFNIPILEMGN